jgi:hypothetical protein
MLEHCPQRLQIGFPNWMVSFFQPWGPIQGHKVEHLLVALADWKYFFLLALTPSVKPLGPISTFTQIGMLDLGWTSAQTPSVKLALLQGRNVPNPVRNLACLIFSSIQQQAVGYGGLGLFSWNLRVHWLWVSGGRGEGAGLKLTPNRFWDNAWQGSSNKPCLLMGAKNGHHKDPSFSMHGFFLCQSCYYPKIGWELVALRDWGKDRGMLLCKDQPLVPWQKQMLSGYPG